MPYKSKNTNHDSKSQKGDPANHGTSKAGLKTTGGPEEIDRAEDIVARHLDDDGNPVPEAITHPNRNLRKPDIDKPSYGGS
ncbi:hypothetical protein ACD591_18960 [Rufibacter glacialis]|uniref:Uncharacterized protein n=1 Tax=Rufibacter glacialis TaxID=1259555 RepID=A0A5M8QPF0_9BACT|nr:hypothetical protein [Rufibacter glacialis]KAA6438097.1 hypothetical protein FOE74_00190 [Rufibacter glacialis]GGK88517.1 hypothetical protein GCM10011405_40350 [Rufibacter glacialis]